MSQKLKNLPKGYSQISDCIQGLPPDVKRVGYLRKLKKMKRRFFVLHTDSDSGAARLEYYSSEKKWRSGGEPRRSIELKSCLNISRKLHSKQKNVIALYTQDDCFSVVADNANELEFWLQDILEIQRAYFSTNENMKQKLPYEYLWQVVIDRHDLECSYDLMGPHRVALTSKSLVLIKMNTSNECDQLEFPLMSIRRCGHSKDHFFIELGRSAITGAGEIYMATEATIIAQNMHETVLSAMKSSKIRENGNPLPRPRSASISENTDPVTSRRPVGIIAPLSVSPVTCNTLSSSRERCDSLPTRPKTLSEIPHSCILNSLSSPHSSEIACRRFARPHSMYEWPSFSSPSSKNICCSPTSLSSAVSGISSAEEMDIFRSQSSSYCLQKPMEGIVSSEQPLSELPDEYLMMSPMKDPKPLVTEGHSCVKQPVDSNVHGVSSYMDMKSSSFFNFDVTETSVKRKDGYMPMTPNGISSGKAVVMQYQGHLDMSPTSLSNKTQNSTSLLEKNRVLEQNGKQDLDGFLVGKVTASINTSLSNVSENENNKILNNTLKHKPATRTPLCEVKQANSVTHDNLTVSKPPIPERMHHKPENVAPPLPPPRIPQKSSFIQRKSFSNICRINSNKNLEENVKDTQTKSHNIQKENELKGKLKEQVQRQRIPETSGADQNVNFACLSQSNESKSNCFFQCITSCSSNKVHDNKRKMCNLTEELVDQKANVDSKLLLNNSDSESSQNLNLTYPANTCTISNPKDGVFGAYGDYVNLEFKKYEISASQSSANTAPKKNSLHLFSSVPLPEDPNYSNIHFGKPFCPTPNPILAACENISFKTSGDNKNTKAEPSPHTFSGETHKNFITSSKLRTIPNSFPAFRKQMSAPAVPPSLRAELPSPGRKSSCPVTASGSIIRPSMPPTVSTVKMTAFQMHLPSGHLRVSTSCSPDHSSVSSISSASDEISSNHSSPKTLTLSQNFGSVTQQNVTESQYENVVIPKRPCSRPPSVNSEKNEKELNYASLDLTPSVIDNVPKSPNIKKPVNIENVDSLMYAEIDFTKSEGLKNISGTVREGRL